MVAGSGQRRVLLNGCSRSQKALGPGKTNPGLWLTPRLPGKIHLQAEHEL